jgi:hypothetical protein
MSIKQKNTWEPPDEPDLPPYAKDTRCWGCEQLFDAYSEMRPGDQGLCPKCAKLATSPS